MFYIKLYIFKFFVIIGTIDNLIKLEDLICDGTPITNVNKLINLKSIRCHNTKFITSISRSPKLKTIHSMFSNLSVIEYCKILEVIDCRYSKVTNIDTIRNLKYFYGDRSMIDININTNVRFARFIE